ncbi:MAG: hypothetical protein LBD55_12300 [Treponema sp.]|jgi:hypothetical protein|nr:hypothetical protein [Treponema sp.]
MVYLGIRKDGTVANHTDKQAMKEIDGIEKPSITVTDAEFEAAGGLARVIEGKIILGKNDDEKAEEEKPLRVMDLRRRLAETDYLAVKIAEGSATKEEYADQIAQRQAWREEIRRLGA